MSLNWVLILWSMAASASLTMAVIHFLAWYNNRTAWSNLLFCCAAIGAVATATCELWMMRVDTPAELATALRWTQVAVWVALLSLTGFVLLYLRAGRIWLAWTICVLRTLSLILNFLVGQNLNYLEITGLRHVRFLGESVAVAEGVANPSMLVGQFSLVLFLAFVADAALSVWRRKERRLALVTGGSILLCILGASVQCILVFWGAVRWPIIPSVFFVAIVAAMACEMSRRIDADGRGKLVTVSNVSLEFPERLGSARETARRRSELAHLSRVSRLSELSVSIGHEINQPLQSILSNAQAALLLLAQENPDLGEIRAILKDIVLEDWRANEVILKLRALLKKDDSPDEMLSVNELVQGVLSLLHGELLIADVAVTLKLAPKLPSIKGQRIKLQQALLNLIINGCDAMTGVSLDNRELLLTTQLNDDGSVLVCITDRGPGISPEAAGRVFDAFFTTKSDGLGLGLSVSRLIISSHGGRLWAAASETGSGASFCFTLPAASHANRAPVRS
jgi:C4-dicarboxylate-specific signal transduction histidine kinase